MKNLLKLLVLSLILSSCGDFEPVVYDNVNGQTLAFFDKSTSSLEIVIDDVGSVDVQIGSSTLSSSARTVTVSVVQENTTADPASYSFSPSVTIPANEYFGTLTISGVDNNVETTAETLTLKLDSVEGSGITSSATHAVSIFQICPVPATSFVGNYLIEQQTPYVDGPTLSDGSVITVEVGSSSTERVFDTFNYAQYCQTPNPFRFSLVCNEIISAINASNCTCGGDGLFFGTPVNGAPNETYDVNDDSVFFLTFGDDITTNCGPPVNTTYKFTKQ